MNISFKKTILASMIFIILVVAFSGYFYRENLSARWKLYNKGYEYSSEEFFNQVRTGSPDIVKLFLNAGMKQNLLNKDGDSIILASIKAQNRDVINYLSERGIHLFKSDIPEFFRTVKKGTPQKLKHYFKFGSPESFENEMGQNPSHVAVKAGKISNLKFLVEKDIDLNKFDENGLTPLHYAVINKSNKLTKYLIQNGASINLKITKEFQDYPKGYTALMIALEDSNKKLSKTLIRAGAKIGSHKSSTNALKISMRNDLEKITEMIIKHNPNPSTSVYSETLSDFIGKTKHQNELNFLLDQNLSQEVLTKSLDVAIESSNYQMVKKIINHGAKLKSDQKGELLNEAVFEGNESFVRYLLNRGADPNFRTNQMESTPLITASEEGHTEIVKILLENGAYINAQNKSGDTAVILACVARQWKTAEVLRTNGADMSIENDYGDSGYQMCR